MSEGTNNLLEKAVQEMNETDAKGAVGQIKNLIRGINANDEKIAVLVKHNDDLKKQINKLVSKGGLTADKFAA